MDLALNSKLQEVRSDWKPASIIVDNAQAELNVLRDVWPKARIFLCFWHVRKSWLENAVKKISRIEDRASILSEIGDIMYAKGFSHGDDPIEWALEQLESIKKKQPEAARFMKYMDKEWRKKVDMWCLANRSIPHAGQNTNAAIESYHSNLKRILFSGKQRLTGRRIDWLIYHLVGDVHTYYWYGRVLKENGFITNKNQELIVASAIVRARAIPDDHVQLYPDGKDIAMVLSVNSKPKVWTVYSPNLTFAQCDCPISLQAMICKHVMKAFLMENPRVEEGLIVREAGTMYGVNKTTPLSQVFGYVPPTTPISSEIEEKHINTAAHGGNNNLDCPKVFRDIKECIVSLGSVERPIDLSLDKSSYQASGKMITQKTGNDPEEIFKDLVSTTGQHSVLQPYLVADLKSIRGRYRRMLARGIGPRDATQTTPTFPTLDGDNSLKRRKGRLEPKTTKRMRF